MEALLKQKKKPRKNSLNPKAEEDTLNRQIRSLNEAMQYLSKKRTKSSVIQEAWQAKGNKTAMISLALSAMTVDEQTKLMRQPGYAQKMRMLQEEQERQSRDAVAMAEALLAGIEAKQAETKDRKDSNENKDRKDSMKDRKDSKRQ